MKTIKRRTTSEGLTIIGWLYRYVFRGAGVLLVIGMITILYLAVSSRL